MTGATIRDVARRAAVSVASVSRALNGLSSVHPDTRARVLAAAEALGYVPHAGARSLSLARTHAIGVVMPDLHGEFFSEVIRGLASAASARGYHLILSNIDEGEDHMAAALRAMRGRVDGLVAMAPHVDPPAFAALLPAKLPTVTINTPDYAGGPALRVDNRSGAAAVARHFVAIGRKRFAHVAGPGINADARERRDGFAAALPPGTPIAMAEGDFTEAGGARAMAELLATDAAIDAVFVANDMMALGALQTLRDAGRRIPEDLAVAGFDDVPLARYVSLTTLRVNMADLGGRAATRLIDALESKGAGDVPTADLIVPPLIVRGTTVMEP